MNNITKIAVFAAKRAGKLLAKEYENFDRTDSRLKSKHELQTRADLISEDSIIKEVRKHFPDHRILSEETGERGGKGEYFWVVDPLDGTTNFTMHNPLWAVSIGVAKADDLSLILGVVYAPILGEIFIAEKGKGAQLNGRKIRVSNVSTGKVLNTFCHGNREADLKRAVKYYSKQKLGGFDCRQIGSASLELSFVAAGRVESLFIPGAHPWDVAAGALLVREAEGKVTDLQGRDWTLESADILATNGKVHVELLKQARG